MTSKEQFCLKWNDFQNSATSAFKNMRNETDFTDVTLVFEDGQQLEAHKLILAASSPIFQNILKKNRHHNPLIYMRGLKSEYFAAILDFIYYGESKICQENLDNFLKLAEELKLKGLSGNTREHQSVNNIRNDTEKFIPVKNENVQTNDTQKIKLVDNMLDNWDYEPVLERSVAITMTSDLQELDERIRSMMTSSDAFYISGQGKGRTCKVCGKEGNRQNIKDHIEAHHIEGVSHGCNICEKKFR